MMMANVKYSNGLPTFHEFFVSLQLIFVLKSLVFATDDGEFDANFACESSEVAHCSSKTIAKAEVLR